MAKITDFDLWCCGLRDQEDTWWGKKIKEYEAAVDSGKYGIVHKKWTASDGWGDGVQVPHYILEKDNELFKAYCSESGVFKKLKSGGAASISAGGENHG